MTKRDKMPQGKEVVSDETLLQAFSEIPGGFASSKEIAERFDHSRQWAHQRLSELYDSGRVSKKKSGSRNVVWWPAEAKYHAFPGDTQDQQA